jgi:microcystin-dependent protein
LQFWGATNTARTVVIPVFVTPTQSRVWVVENRTGGAITVIQSGGTGVVVGAARSAPLWLDHTQKAVRRVLTDYTDAYLVNCRGVTPATNATGEEVVNASWVRQAIASSSGFRTGDVKLSYAWGEEGWVRLVDWTIGGPLSGASARAGADCEALFKLLWANVDNAWCPVIGGRGASANADWLGNKQITLPRLAGRALGVVGDGAGLTGRPLGAYTGTELHTLSLHEMPWHDHGGITGVAGWHGHNAWTDAQGNHKHGLTINQDRSSGAMGNAVFGDEPSYGTTFLETTEAGNHGHNVGVEANGQHDHFMPGQGGSGAHNNMPPTAFLNAFIKL